ncbi:hypothetical protein O181_129709 [Austropuccinia psidii MF-1]|uniref:Uncharacterized protein n=1 Tax=Austropuccinia psidii MF-1 TaxID=1389203 RepID=A0A9Q3KZK4_9BASI|nr:hypothetical protein [Austropuccinia psidii MF-1]
MSLFFKDISVVTGHLSKIMTSSYSFNHSTFCHCLRKPTTHSERWKLSHSSYSSNLDNTTSNNRNLPLHATTNIKAGIYMATSDCESRSTQPSAPQYMSRNQRMVVMKHKISYPLNPEEALTAHTASNNRSFKVFV